LARRALKVTAWPVQPVIKDLQVPLATVAQSERPAFLVKSRLVLRAQWVPSVPPERKALPVTRARKAPAWPVPPVQLVRPVLPERRASPERPALKAQLWSALKVPQAQAAPPERKA
jgi:hypothetical protein